MATIGELVGKVRLEAGNALTTLDQFAKQTEKAGASFDKMYTRGAIAIGGLTASLFYLGNAAGNAQEVMQGFSNNFGKNVEGNLAVLKQATEGTVSEFDLMKDANKASMLGITDNIEVLGAVMAAAKQKAEQLGLSTTEAMDLMARGINSGSSRALAELGIKLPDSIDNLDSSVSKATKTQIILNEILKQSADYAAQYGDSVNTVADETDILGAQFQDAKVALGSALTPALSGVLKVITPVVQAFSAFAKTNPEVIRTVGMVAAGLASTLLVAGGLGKAIGGVSAFFTAIRTGAIAAQLSLGLVGVALVAVGYLFAKNYMQLSQANQKMGEGAGNANLFQSALDKLGASGANAGNLINNKMGEAAKRIKDVQDAIKEENESFNKQLNDIITQREKSVSDNKKQLEKETIEFKKQQEANKRAYEKNTEDLKKQNAQRVKDLETSMGESLIKGSDTYTTDAENFAKTIEDEKQLGQERLDTLTQQYNDETEAAKAEFQDRTSALQAQLDEDEAFLLKHAEIAKTINHDIAQDEIDTLVTAHQKRIDDLNAQLAEEGTAYGTAFDAVGADFSQLMTDMNSESIDWGSVIGNVKLKDVLKGVWQDISALGLSIILTVYDAVTGVAETIASTINDVLGKLGPVSDLLSAMGVDLGGDMSKAQQINAQGRMAIVKAWGSVYGTKGTYASGTPYFEGGKAWVGERGPEEVILPRGTQIIPTEQNADRSSRTINNYNNFYNGVDIDTFNARLNFQLKF